MAFDFDDMEAEAQARLDAGEDDAARLVLGAVEGPGAWRGGKLLPMRNIAVPQRQHLPATQDLSRYLPTLKFQLKDTANIRVRLFVFPGAGDSVGAWYHFLNQVPDWIDVAVFERPGHGLRTAEPVHTCLVDEAKEAFDAVGDVLQEHTKGGPLEGAPFAMLGHSMGCQIMVEVALLAKRRLGLEPTCMFAVDRGAPHVPLYTDEGYRMLCLEESLEFFEGFNPTVHKLMTRPKRREEKDTERMIEMWTKDLRSAHEHVWPEGHHIFHCDVHVFRAARNYAMDQKKLELPAELERVRELMLKITNSGPTCSAPWSWSSYDEWRQWTTESCEVHDVDAEHIGVKIHADTISIVVDALKQKTDQAS